MGCVLLLCYKFQAAAVEHNKAAAVDLNYAELIQSIGLGL